MYRFNSISTFRLTTPNTYVYDLVPTEAGLAIISSDDCLRLLDPLNLDAEPARTVQKIHDGVTCLQSLADEHVVVTGGRDGRVRLTDLRTGGRVGEVSTESSGSVAPVLSLATSGPRGLAAGTELTSHQASILLWDTRSLGNPVLQYCESHSDDVTELQFHPSRPQILLSGSTDGLVNIFNTTITDEEEALHQTINHGASIHHANFLNDVDIFALSHDEKLSIYELVTNPEDGEEPKSVHYGDMREGLGGEYMADIVRRPDGSAVLGVGTHNRDSFDLIQVTKNPPWTFVPETKVTLTGAHGSEIVRAFCFLDSHKTVLTAGEDGQVKSWTG